jgi:hypothetical protein
MGSRAGWSLIINLVSLFFVTLCLFNVSDTEMKTPQIETGQTLTSKTGFGSYPGIIASRGVWQYSQNNLYYVIYSTAWEGLETPTYYLKSFDNFSSTGTGTTIYTLTPTAGYTMQNYAVIYEFSNVLYVAYCETKAGAGPTYDTKVHLFTYTHATTTWSADLGYDVADKYFYPIDLITIGGTIYLVGAIITEIATGHAHIEIRKWDNSATATDTIEIDLTAGVYPEISPGFIDADDDYQFLLTSSNTTYWREWTGAAYAAIETLPVEDFGEFLLQDGEYYLFGLYLYVRASATSWPQIQGSIQSRPTWSGTNREFKYVFNTDALYTLHQKLVKVTDITTTMTTPLGGFDDFLFYSVTGGVSYLATLEVEIESLLANAGYPFRYGYGQVPSGSIKTNATIANNQYLAIYNDSSVLWAQAWIREYNDATGHALLESPILQDLMKDITVASGTDWDVAIKAVIDTCRFFWYNAGIDNVAGTTPVAYKGKFIDFLIWADQVNAKRHYWTPAFEVYWDDGDTDTGIDVEIGVDGVYNVQKIPVNLQYSRIEAQGALLADGTYAAASYQTTANYPTIIMSFPQYQTSATLQTFISAIGPKFDQVCNRYSFSVVGKAFIQFGQQITLVSTHFEPLITSGQYYVVANNVDPVSGHQHLIVENVLYYISNNVGITLGSLYQQIQSSIAVHSGTLTHAQIDLLAGFIPPMTNWYPTAGFAASVGSGFGPHWWVAHDDTEAYMWGSFHVADAGTYKIGFWLTSEEAATYGGFVYVSATESGQAAVVKINVEAFDCALTTAAKFFLSSSSFTVNANSYVFGYYKKSDHPAVINGSMYFLGGGLVRQ